jgi:dipeptidyl aminopeptidase/acylaminoacyl peptidase
VEQWVVQHLSRSLEPGTRGVEDIAEVDVHPTADLVACTVLIRDDPMTKPHRRVLVVDLEGDRTTPVDVPFPECSGPAWSPDGTRLAVVASTEDTAEALVLDGPPHGFHVSATSSVPGLVETLEWSPDGTRLALRVAMPGAEISDVFGSGVVGSATGAEPWRPRVFPARGGERTAYVWEPVSGSSDVVSEGTVWELAWSGDDALLALTSDEPGESAWYSAELTRIDLGSGRRTTLLAPEHQLSLPRANPDGARWSVLSAVQSDRGLPSGTLLLGGQNDETPVAVDTHDVYLNDHRWLDADTLLVAGLRGLDTVVATIDVSTGTMTTAWSGEATCGGLQPEVAGRPGRPPVVVLEEHGKPPALGELTENGFRQVLRVDGPGADHVTATAGTATRMSWRSSDGLEIQGLLLTPETAEAPYPLVVDVHGGPTHAFRSTWLGRDPHASCLLARGYAVLRPNPRGSTGRGAAFAAAVAGDMGGLDVADVVSGVQHLVDDGVADPGRLGITGISYGGFMATWVPTCTDSFAASVARSPCTDWLLQHLTSNIAEFDRRFLVGDPFDRDSHYGTRSPLRHVDRIRTPTLLTAGMQDLATPPSQAQVLYTALRERGVESELVLYPDEGHGVRVPATLADQCARMVAWFERHMPA